METKLTGKKLVITVDLIDPKESSTGKSLIVYSSGGFLATTAQVNGKPVKINLTAIIAK